MVPASDSGAGTMGRPRGSFRGWGDGFFPAPMVLLVAVVVVYPAVVALGRSFYRWSPAGESPFVGLENYRDLLGSDVFRQVFANHGVYVLGLPLWVFLPLVVAVLLQDRVPKPHVFRMILLFPSILSPAIVGILFRGILAREGLLNAALEAVGLGTLTADWLGDASLVKFTIIGVIAWAYLGLGVFIFSAALMTIPKSLIEAGLVDGAGWWQRLRYIIIPQVRPTIAMWAFFQLIAVFLSIFPWIFVLTRGGPAYASATLDYSIYNAAIRDGRFGLASAMSVLLVLTVVALVVIAAASAAFARRWAGDRRGSRWRGRRRIALAPAPLRGTLSSMGAARTRVRNGRLSRGGRGMWHTSIVRTAAFIAVSFVYLSPFVFLVFTAIKPREDYLTNRVGIPRSVTLDFIEYAWNSVGLGNAMINSATAVIIAVPILLLLASLASFWFLRHSGRRARLLFYSVVGLAMIPFIVYMIPLFVLLARAGVTNSLAALGIVYVAVLCPFALYLTDSYAKRGIPSDLLEAASIDGAGLFAQYRHIFLPLSRPILGTLATLAAIFVWGDLIVSVVLIHDPSKLTAIVAASGIQAAQLGGAFSVPVQESAAASLLVVIPVLVIFLIGQRALGQGLVDGADR